MCLSGRHPSLCLARDRRDAVQSVFREEGGLAASGQPLPPRHCRRPRSRDDAIIQSELPPPPPLSSLPIFLRGRGKQEFVCS